jgi:hypothetical protein
MHSVQNRKATNKIFNLTNSWLQPNTRQSTSLSKQTNNRITKRKMMTERLFPITNYVAATKLNQGTIQYAAIIKQEPKLT